MSSKTWIGATGVTSAWSTSADWSPAGAPGTADLALFAGTDSIDLTGPGTAGEIVVATNYLNIDGGTINLAGLADLVTGAVTDLRLEGGGGLTVLAGQLIGSAALVIGGTAIGGDPSGHLAVFGGTLASGSAVIGNAIDASHFSDAAVEDAGALWTIAGKLQIGVKASASFLVGDDAKVTAGAMDVGADITGSSYATAAISRVGTLAVAGLLQVGNFGSSGSLVIDTGGVLTAGTLLLGPQGGIQFDATAQLPATINLLGGSLQFYDIVPGNFGFTLVNPNSLYESSIFAQSAGAPLELSGLLQGGAYRLVGTMKLDNPANTATLLDVQGRVELAVAGAGGVGSINFLDGGRELVLDTTLPGIPITGFADDSTIDLVALPFVTGASAVVHNGTLTVTSNGLVHNLTVTGQPSGAILRAIDDGGGGTAVIACFAAGTRIATGRGEVAVEHLRIGDLAVSAFGGVAPVVWIGHRTVDCAGHPRPQDVWPVRVRSGAFGRGCPERDLLLSPDHAVHVAARPDAPGVLIPIRHLLNAITIVQEPRDRVTYFHVQLPAHDVLLAEGLACESYLDTGNRHAFANGGTVAALHPDFAQRIWEAEACAPQITHGPVHAEVHARLLALAAEQLAGRPGRITRAG